MARNHDEINFRNLYHKFLLVKDIDVRTRLIMKQSGFRVRQDDNAVLVLGYIDYEVGLSFEVLCAACVFEDGDVSLEPASKTTAFKLRYGSFQGDIIPFNNQDQLLPYVERAKMIMNGYGAPDAVMQFREIEGIDPSRAPGYPDDIIVFFIKEGYRNEGIWCRVVDADPERHLIQMRMLNEPNAPFGKHSGDIVDVALITMDNGELKAVAIL